MYKKLSEIANITMGQSPKSMYYNVDAIGMPFMQGCTTFGYKYPNIDTWTTNYNKLAKENDILFTVRAPVGDINIANKQIAIGRGLAAISSINNTSFKYLYYLLLANKNKFVINSSGTVYDSINKNQLENIELDVHTIKEQQHIVDIIGSIDDKIENNNKLCDKMYEYLDLEMKKRITNEYTTIGELNCISFIKSGIKDFTNEKVYLDTSCVSDTAINDYSYKITIDNRPSRANMQPSENTVWFAKLKDSPKYIIVKEYTMDLLDNFIFSTGFCGLKIEKEKFNLLASYIISNLFDKEKNSLSVGATMQSVNNESIKSIKIPYFTELNYNEFNKISEPIFKMIYECRIENKLLEKQKRNYLNKFFD